MPKEEENNAIESAWNKILSSFPEQLQKEFQEERPNPTQEDIERYESLRLLDPEPTSVPLEELLKKNGDYILMAPPDVIEEINRKWGTNFDAKRSRVHDPDPDRIRKYSQMPAETAAPSVMVDGEIGFGVGRFMAALLRKDKNLRVWNLTRKPDDKK